MDLDAIFDGKPVAESPASPTPAEIPAPPPEPQAPETPPEAPPEPAPPPKDDEQDRRVPLATFLDMRDRVKAAERRAAELEAARPQPGNTIPDPYDSPDEYHAHVAQLVADQTLNLKFELSESMARDKHGDDLVQKAMEWGAEKAQGNPGFRTEFLAQKNPIDWVVRQQKRDGLLSAVGDDEEAFIRRRAVEMGLIAAPDAGAGVVSAPVMQQAPKPPAPPRSIAAAPSAGGQREVPTGPMAALDAVFTR